MPDRRGRSNVVRVASGITTAIRSGRFQTSVPKATSAVDPGTVRICDDVEGLSYRVFNSWKTDYKVKVSGYDSVSLVVGGAVDLLVGSEAGESSLCVLNEDIENRLRVEGVYDVLDNPWNPIRSGRFVADTTEDLTIVQGRVDHYRIFNSRKLSIIKAKWMSEDGDAKEELIMPKCSVDLAIVPPLKVAHYYSPSTTSHEIEGIYEYLERGNPVRSGRFAYRRVEDGGVTVINPADPHTIIDLSSDASTMAWYRIFNSGENVIKLLMTGSNEAIDVPEDQSYDFLVPAGGVVAVKSGPLGKPIRGMYELLEQQEAPEDDRSARQRRRSSPKSQSPRR